MSETAPLLDPDEVELTTAVGPAGTLTNVELDGETVIYDESNGSIHLLDPIATVVWSVLDGTSTLAEIAADVAEAFSAPVAQVSDDVLALARMLGRSGLLAGVRGDGTATALPGQADPDSG